MKEEEQPKMLKVDLKIFRLWRLPLLHPAFIPFLQRWVTDSDTLDVCPRNQGTLKKWCKNLFQKRTDRKVNDENLDISYVDPTTKEVKRINSDQAMKRAFFQNYIKRQLNPFSSSQNTLELYVQ